MESTLTPDTQVVLLLCGELGQRAANGPKPLGLRQYNALASWLKSRGLRPGDLLTSDGRTELSEFQFPDVNSGRVTPLLDRGAALALIVEKWERCGLWVISRSDACYPERLKRYLGHSAPPLLYGVGCKDLLNRGGLAVVGSRDRSEEDGDFARRVGEYCAKDAIAIISGAAKGIDRDAMSAALEAGGWALGVLAEGLAKTATSGQYRSDLVNDRLTLVSPYDPDSRWFAYAAMERNKILYGLSDAALVVASSAETGGTWAGATEALQHGRVKVFVKSVGNVAPGNPKLLRMGATAFPPEPWVNLRSLFTPPEEKIGQLFPVTTEDETDPQEPPAGAVKPMTPLGSQSTSERRETEVQPAASIQASGESLAGVAYTLVIEQIVTLCAEPQTEDWLATHMDVRRVQLKDWLDRAIGEGRIKKLRNPVRYAAISRTLFAG